MWGRVTELVLRTLLAVSSRMAVVSSRMVSSRMAVLRTLLAVRAAILLLTDY